MKSTWKRPIDRVHYDKPAAVDLGPAAPIVGASCATGEQFDIDGFCAGVGNHASVTCSDVGSTAQFGCGVGIHCSSECGEGPSII